MQAFYHDLKQTSFSLKIKAASIVFKCLNLNGLNYSYLCQPYICGYQKTAQYIRKIVRLFALLIFDI